MRAFDISGRVLSASGGDQALVAVLMPRGFELLETMAGVLRADVPGCFCPRIFLRAESGEF